MDKPGLLAFLQSHRLAAQSSVSLRSSPQAAIVGYAVSSDFEFVFDTVTRTRKVENLRTNPEIALTIGGFVAGDEQSVQCNGIADEPKGSELERLKRIYFEKFPEGRERADWDGITYFRVRPTWIRYGDYKADPPLISEFTFGSS